MRKPMLDRFWAKVRKSDGCWEWTASRGIRGYGQFRLPRTRQMSGAHRVAYELSVGPIPEGMFVCHHCDNPSCVRPDHLFVGTNSQNILDAVRKGRHRTVFKRPKRTHCFRGHELTPENCIGPKRKCRMCNNARVTRNRRALQTMA